MIRYLRRPAVEDLTGLSRSTIYQMMAEGRFPRPIKITGKAVAWSQRDVEEWLAKRPSA